MKNEWEKERKKVAHRRRRIIMNNDGDDAYTAPEATPEAFWAQRFNGLEKPHVDSIFYNTSMWSFNRHNYNSKIAELFAGGDIDIPNNQARIFIDQGWDCLQLALDFCRKNRIEMFWSLRMNDIHDNWYPNMYSQFKKDHPQLLLFQPTDIGRPRSPFMEPHMYATAVDYGQREIREQQLAIIREVCQEYDIDGIELDFMRQPIFFRPTLEGRPVEPEHLEIMTGFMRQVREVTEEAGQKRDRPILIACRIPSRVRCNEEIGLDIEKWLVDDLIDLVISSLEGEPFTGPVEELAMLGHRYEVPVYAGLTGVGINYLENTEGPAKPEAWCGAAMRAWNAGADGIYLFNMFDPHAPLLHHIGDPIALKKTDKIYAVDNLAGQFRTHEHVLSLEGRLPVELPLGSSRAINIRIGDDVPGHAQTGVLKDIILRTKVEHLTYDDELEFKLNDKPLPMEVVYATEGRSPTACGIFLLRASPEPASIIKGDNKFEAILKKRCKSAPGLPSITDLQFRIRYKNNPN